MHPDAYIACSGPGRFELKEKGSRFLAFALPVGDDADAARQREKLLARFPDASHHCWAQIIGSGDEAIHRRSDDGEPAGSAGAPIARAIQASELGDLLVVVVRWFGGTKLGVGGLIRAYGDAARQALDAAPRCERLSMQRLSGRGPYELEGKLRSLVGAERGNIIEAEHGPDGVDWVIEIPKSTAEKIARQLLDLSRGRFKLRP